jgi:hypothetical protein
MFSAAVLALGAMPVFSQSSCIVSRADFNAITAGMTDAQVISQAGCRGELMSEVDVGGIRSAVYSWQGVGEPGANMIVTVQNGRVIMKAQYGLR